MFHWNLVQMLLTMDKHLSFLQEQTIHSWRGLRMAIVARIFLKYLLANTKTDHRVHFCKKNTMEQCS